MPSLTCTACCAPVHPKGLEAVAAPCMKSMVLTCTCCMAGWNLQPCCRARLVTLPLWSCPGITARPQGCSLTWQAVCCPLQGIHRAPKCSAAPGLSRRMRSFCPTPTPLLLLPAGHCAGDETP